MKTKTLFIILAAILFLSSVSFSQTDSLKTLKIKNHNVVLGQYYEIFFPDIPPVKGKLIAVNKSSILMLIKNEMEEFELNDITYVQDVEADNIIYTSSDSRKVKPVYSLSAGYVQNNSGYYDYSYDYYNRNNLKFDGFNVSGDALLKISENFGFRFDLSYLHIFGKSYSGYSYYSSYDTATYGSSTDYAALNLLSIRTGILFGSMSRNEPFNFYVYIGLGFGWTFHGNNTYYNTYTKNGLTKTTQYQSSNKDDLLLGAHAQIRLSYKVSKKYMLFVEPSIQYWSTNINRIYAINSGITFTL